MLSIFMQNVISLSVIQLSVAALIQTPNLLDI